MVKRHECSFCGYDITPGEGWMFVRNDGRVLRFCSKKCRTSMLEKGRDPRDYKWTKKHEKAS